MSFALNFSDMPACATADPNLFFPIGNWDFRRAEAAKRVCSGCPVRDECLQFALEHGEQGVWGGTTWSERAQIRATGASREVA